MANVYTRSGDKGTTGLFGGSRAAKDDIRVEAFGTMDEATSAIGVAYAATKDEEIREILHHIQERIFVHAAELSSDARGREMLQNPVSQEDIDYMEQTMDHYLAIIGKQTEFIIPGKNVASAALHQARTIVRRAERRIVSLQAEDETVRPELVKFANRLSDLLFVLARTEEFEESIREVVIELTSEDKGKDSDMVLEEDPKKLLTIAKRIAVGCRIKAQELGVPIVFSCVDLGGNLAYYERQEDALLASIDISQNKAFTANALKMPTSVVYDLAKEESPLFGLQFTNQGRIVTFGGGYPLIVDGKQIGAIGISGGTVEQDCAIAEAGLAVLDNE
jgi:ATP:cob(I)alamin adenosyltransferase